MVLTGGLNVVTTTPRVRFTAFSETTDASTTDPAARTPNPKATNLKRANTFHIILSPSSILQFARRNLRLGRRVVNLPSLAHFHSRLNRFLEWFVREPNKKP
jgi:hypothetical protein